MAGRKARVTPAVFNIVHKAREAGMTRKEIQEATGLSETTIDYVLKHNTPEEYLEFRREKNRKWKESCEKKQFRLEQAEMSRELMIEFPVDKLGSLPIFCDLAKQMGLSFGISGRNE